jgi:amino acid adenylation domain-containing protein
MKKELPNPLSHSEEKEPLSREEKLALLKMRLQERAGGQASFPLSYNQQSIWAFHQANPGLACYNLKFSARIIGLLDSAALKCALQKVVDRHAMLRTTYSSTEKGPVQQIHEDHKIHYFEIHDPGWSRGELKKQVRAAYQLPFNLETGPVFRVHLFKTSVEDHVLLITMHHIACDGWSLLVILDELRAFYEAEAKRAVFQLPPPKHTYHDFVKAQTHFINSEKGTSAFSYWKEQLEGELPLLDLPFDYPGQELQRHRGATLHFTLAKESVEQYKKFSQTENVTLYAFFLAVLQVLLHRYSGQDDLVIGAPVSERDNSQYDTTVGHFINPLAIRSNFRSDPGFRSLLQEVRHTFLNGLNYKEYPFPLIVKHLNQARQPGSSPVFQALMVMQKIPQTLRIGNLFLFGREEQVEWADGLRLQSFDFPEQEGQFDLVLELREAREGIFCAFKYNCDLFEEATIVRMSDHFKCLLNSAVSDPEKRVSALALMTQEERSELLNLHHNEPPHFASDKCMHQLFEEQVARTPGAVALSLEGRHLTYEELNRRANRLARKLQKQGVTPNQLVGLLTDRSFEMIIGILGILKAGGAYLPLDPDYPPQRLAFMLRDAGIQLLLLKKETASLLDSESFDLDYLLLGEDQTRASRVDQENLNLELSSDNLAYAIYTSGSLGRPKGVLISHANVHRLFTATEAFFHFNETDVWTLFHSFAFDFSVWEMWGALIYGGRLVIIPYLTSRSPKDFYQLLLTEKVTVLNQTPSAFRQIVTIDQQLNHERLALRYVIFGGEQLDQQSLRPWFDKHGYDHPQLINMYGITETTVHVTYKRLTRADVYHPKNSLGRPIPDLQIFILDKNGEPVPVGVRGEIYVGGAGLAKSYLNRPDLTSERFCYPLKERPDLLLYKTGDLASYLSNGEIAYLGRNDSQVKLRGFRIELGEIESLLRTHADVSDALVQVVSAPSGPQLVAYVIAKDEKAISIPGLREHLRSKLPAHMVPGHILEITSIPLTSNGKIDRKALPLPSGEKNSPVLTGATTLREHLLSQIWGEVLNVAQVGIHDNFFELGGDSINAIQIIGKAKERGLHFSVKDLFHCQTIYELAAVSNDSENELTGLKPSSFELFKGQQLVDLPAGIVDAYPLSSLQLAIVYHTFAPDKDTFIYHNINSFRLAGRFKEDQLKEAISYLMKRHSILRTSIELHQYDEPSQLIHENVPVPLSVEDLSPYSEEEQKKIFDAWFEKEKRTGFSLSQPPLFRFHVFIYSPSCFELSLTEHHAILDGWSMAALITELLQIYQRLLRAELLALAPSPSSSFRDYVAAEKEVVNSGESRSFWEAQLEDVRVGVLPKWPARYLDDSGGKDTKYSVFIPEEISERLVRLSVQLGVPLKTILLSAHCYVLSLLYNQPQVTTGVVANGRFEESDGDQVLGLFLNALPLPMHLAGGSWISLVNEIFEKEKALLAFRRFPLLELQRLKQEKFLFEVLFNFTHFHIYEVAAKLEEIKFIEARFFERTNYALTVHFNKHPLNSRIHLDLSFDPGIVAPDQVKLIGAIFQGALAAIVHNPSAPYDKHRPSGAIIPEMVQDSKIYFGEGERQNIALRDYLDQRFPSGFKAGTIQLLGHFSYPCPVGLPGKLYLGQEPLGAELIYLPQGDLCSYKPFDWFAQQRAYWLNELGDLPAQNFPAEAPGLKESSLVLQTLSQMVGHELYERLRACAESADITLPPLLLGALNLTIYLHSGYGDIIVGLPLAGIDKEKHALYGDENILPIRVGLDESKQFDALAAEVQRKLNNAIQHSYPFGNLLEDLQEKKGQAPNLIRTTMTFLNMAVCNRNVGGKDMIVEGVRISNPRYGVDLSLILEPQENELSIQLLYNSQVWDTSTANKLLASYLYILEQVVQAPAGLVGNFEIKLDDEELEEQEEFLKSMYEL